MQLKSLAKTQDALIDIGNLENATNEFKALKDIGKSYTTETLKAAIAQSTLDKEQIKVILSANGLQGKFLELTADELANTASTNMVATSQATTTGTTFGLGAAFKGLGISIKNAAKSMWTFMTSNPVGWIMGIGAAVYGVIKLYDALTVSLKEQKEELQKTKEAYENVKNELQEIENELQNNRNAIKELESSPNLTWVEQAELDRLREATKELELQKQLKQDERLAAAEDLYKENLETFNKEFGSSLSNASVYDLKQLLYSGNVSAIQLDLENNLVDIEVMLQYLTETKDKLTDASEIQDYEEMIAQLTQTKRDLVKNMAENNGLETLSSISEYKQNILEIASVRELTEDEQEFYDYLTSLQKMIYEIYDPATWNSMEFDSIFDTDGIEKTKEELIALQKAGELSPEVLQSYPKLCEAIERSGIIADEESDVFKEFYNEIAALADKQADIIEDDFEEIIPTISSSISTIATQLEPQFTELGKLYNEIFQTDDNGNEIFSLDSIDNAALESLRKSFAEIGEEIGVTFDPAQLESFFAILTDGNSESWEVQQAFNDLATAYLYSTGTLEQLNNETANAIEKQLEQMGVTNAEAVVAKALALKNEELALSKKYLAQEGKELANATDSEVLAFMAEQAEAGYCGKELAALQLQKLLANGTLLDTETDINNVMRLAKAAGIGTESLSKLIKLKALYEKAEVSGKFGDAMLYSALIKKLEQDFQNEVNNFELDPVDIEFKAPDGGNSGASSSAAKQAEKDWKNVLDKETDLLEKQLAANIITFQEYTDKRRQIIEDYYRDGKIKAEDYYDALERMYNHQLSLYDRVVNAVTDRIDDEIDRLNEQKEAIENSYQVKIDAIQEEIDALNKANDARKAQIDLEKAQYEAERARNQRVNKVYDGSQFVYAADMEAVRDAEDDLADKEFQMNISQLETQIELLKEEMENATKSLDNQINALESYKEKWNEISGIYEEQQNKLIAAEILGADWESQVLNGRLDTLRNFTEQYIALLQAQADAAANAKGGNEETPPASYGKKYASGTDHARKGLNLVGEDGTETFIDNDGNVALVTKPTLIPMEGGEVVKNAEETKAMLDTGNIEPVQSEGMRALFERIRNMQPSDFSFQSLMQPLSAMVNFPNMDYSHMLHNTSAEHNIVHIDNNNVSINCPNVTNNSGAEYIMKEFRRLPLDTIQYMHRRNK